MPAKCCSCGFRTSKQCAMRQCKQACCKNCLVGIEGEGRICPECDDKQKREKQKQEQEKQKQEQEKQKEDNKKLTPYQ